MKDEATNEFDPIKFDAEFARVFDERIAAQVPDRFSYVLPTQVSIDVDRQKLHSQKAMLVSDLADANLKIGVLIITNVLALIVGVVMTVLLIWN